MRGGARLHGGGPEMDEHLARGERMEAAEAPLVEPLVDAHFEAWIGWIGRVCGGREDLLLYVVHARQRRAPCVPGP